MVKSPSMALSLDDRKRLAAAYDVFARVDARRKAARRSRKKSKPNEEIKPRSPSGLRGFPLYGEFNCNKSLYFA